MIASEVVQRVPGGDGQQSPPEFLAGGNMTRRVLGNGAGMTRRSLLASSAATLASGTLGGGGASAAGVPASPPEYWGGVNTGTGFFPDEPYLSTSLRAMASLGIRTVRQGMDTVGGRSTGSAFTRTRRERAYEKFR